MTSAAFLVGHRNRIGSIDRSTDIIERKGQDTMRIDHQPLPRTPSSPTTPRQNETLALQNGQAKLERDMERRGSLFRLTAAY